MFNHLDESDGEKGIQVWADPKNNDNNTMIYYTSNVEIEQGDYIICKGYVSDITTFTNSYGTELKAPLIKSDDLEKSTYIEVVSPALNTVELNNLISMQHGYSVKIDKVEFASNETRVYITVTNDGLGKFTLYSDDAAIIQNNKQYNQRKNYDAEYEEIPHDLLSGSSATGILSFERIEEKDFKLVIEAYSRDYDLDSFSFEISMAGESSPINNETNLANDKESGSNTNTHTDSTLTPIYPSAIGTFSGNAGTVIFYNDGTLYHQGIDENNPEDYVMPLNGTWTQTNDTICYSVWSIDGFMWNNPFYDTVYETGIDFLGDYYNRIS